jgi:branched-chain amino acid transport system substrate-binding protein
MLVSAGLWAGCSFTTATGFNECTTDSQCGLSGACLSNYCIPLPQGCHQATGGFDQAERVPLAIFAAYSPGDGGALDPTEATRLDAVTLALGEVNGNGRNGVNGRRFALFACDVGGDSEQNDVVTPQVRFFVSQMKVPAVMASGSNNTLKIALDPVRRDAGTMVISPNATAKELIVDYQQDGTVWRVAPPDSQQAVVLSREILGDLADAGAVNKVQVLYENTTYGQGLSSSLLDLLTRAGKTVNTVPVPDDSVIPSRVADLSAARPDVTVLVLFPPQVNAVMAAAASQGNLLTANGHRWLLTDSAKKPAILIPANKELKGALGTAPAQGAGGGYLGFASRFTSDYHLDPSTTSYTSHFYDATWLVMLSAAWAGRQSGDITGPRMNDGMRNLSGPSSNLPIVLSGDQWQAASSALNQGQAIDVEGASGSLNYDYDAGTPKAPYELWQVTDAGFTTLRTIVP